MLDQFFSILLRYSISSIDVSAKPYILFSFFFLFITLRNVKSIYFYSLLHVYGAFHIPIESKTRPSSLPGNWTWPETGNRLSDASCIFYEIPTSYRADKRRAHDSVTREFVRFFGLNEEIFLGYNFLTG